MESHLAWELLAILALILANGFFALAEFSVIASRKTKLREKVEKNKRGAKQAVKLRENHETFLATIQVGITLVAAMVGVFSGATVVQELSGIMSDFPVESVADAAAPISFALVVLIVTVLSVVLGELVPKYLALSFPERYARYVAPPVSVFVRITSLFSRLLSGMAMLVVRMLGVKRDRESEVVTEDEINQLIIEGREKGIFDETEREFIHSVFEFTHSTVRRAITPRTDVVGINIEAAPLDIVNLVGDRGFSRYPVYRDTIDNVIGMINTKDILSKDMDPRNLDVSQILREPLFVPDSMPLSRLLKEFQKGKNHMAVVLDDFGGTAGIITLEDVLEELVGEIADEYDTKAAPLVKHSDTVAYADGSVWPGGVNELLGTDLPEDGVDTLAGLFMDAVGRLPENNESIRINGVRLTVLEKDENRILRLKLEKVSPEKATED
jgi:putative hemolysin